MNYKILIFIIILFIGYYTITKTIYDNKNLENFIENVYKNPLNIKSEQIDIKNEIKGKQFNFKNIRIDDILIDKDKLRIMKQLPFVCPGSIEWSDNCQGGCKNNNICLNDQCIDAQDLKNLNKFWPIGTIIAFFNLESEIPEGWTICNGKNYTNKITGEIIKVPDLRNKFIIGAGGKYPANSTGGSNYVKLNKDQVPNHSHRHFPSNSGFGCESDRPRDKESTIDLNRNWVARIRTSVPAKKNLKFGSHRSYPANFSPNNLKPSFNELNPNWYEYDYSKGNYPKNDETQGTYDQPHQNQPRYYTMFYIMRVENEPDETDIQQEILDMERKIQDSRPIQPSTDIYTRLKNNLEAKNKVPIV